MRIYLVQRKNSTQRPRIITAPDARTACEFAGFTIETAHCRDITRRCLQPHHLAADEDEAERGRLGDSGRGVSHA